MARSRQCSICGRCEPGSRNWVSVDPTLQRGTGRVVHPATSTIDLRISGGAGPLVRMGRAGRELSLSWPRTLVDLLVRADVDGVSHTFVVKTREAADSPALARLTLGLGGSLAVRDEGSGGLVAVDAGSSGAVLEASRPLMWDSTRRVGVPSMPEGEDPAAVFALARRRSGLTCGSSRSVTMADNGWTVVKATPRSDRAMRRARAGSA